MLIKVVLLFLLAMAALVLVGRALGLGRNPPRTRSGGALLCGRCGRLIGAGERCSCEKGRRP